MKSVEYTRLPTDCRQCIKDRCLVCKQPAYTMPPMVGYDNFPFYSFRKPFPEIETISFTNFSVSKNELN